MSRHLAAYAPWHHYPTNPSVKTGRVWNPASASSPKFQRNPGLLTRVVRTYKGLSRVERAFRSPCQGGHQAHPGRSAADSRAFRSLIPRDSDQRFRFIPIILGLSGRPCWRT